MDNQISQTSIKSIGTVYMYWLFFGVHYAYFRKWGLQIMYWITFGGLGIWAIIDFMTLPEKIVKYRESVFQHKEVMDNYKKLNQHIQIRFITPRKIDLNLAGLKRKMAV